MKKVTEQEWRDKAAGLAEWRKNRTSPPNLDLYKRIVSMVHVGNFVLDCGCGQRHLLTALRESEHTGDYLGLDPFPLHENVWELTVEELINYQDKEFDTVFMLSALDNVKDLNLALRGLKQASNGNIVILTGIGIPPDKNHTVQVDRKDLTDVLGEPTQEIEISPKVFLFEWML